MLSKYPVTTDRGEYLVKVKEGYYNWKVVIYNFVVIKIPYLNIKIKKKLYVYETDIFSFEKWIGKYVELAKKAVKYYENLLDEEEEKEKRHNFGIYEWNSWDGKVN